MPLSQLLHAFQQRLVILHRLPIAPYACTPLLSLSIGEPRRQSWHELFIGIAIVKTPGPDVMGAIRQH